MGNAFRCSYTTRAFKVRYTRARSGGSLRSLRRGATRNFSSLNMCLGAMDGAEEEAATDIPVGHLHSKLCFLQFFCHNCDLKKF